MEMLAYAERYLTAADAAALRPALDHFAVWLGQSGLDEAGVSRPDLDRYLYTLALEGANTAALDQAVLALKGYFAYRAREAGAADPAAELVPFSETPSDRERYIKTEWGLSDAFYGIVPEQRRNRPDADA
jgi:site-specific recombinase XerD